VFMWIEEKAEGNRNARMRLDKASMTVGKFLRRSVKHTGWVIVALATGIAFIGYFTPVRDLWSQITTGTLDFWMGFWLIFFTLATYLNAGWMREQICLHVCPYGRFQSVMFDRDTLIISYDHHRGDPRGSRKRGTSGSDSGLGDCIDCGMCVQVCPTGIDIRDGLQFECIQCAACIDACDSVMDQMGYARGLVKYTTENLLENKGDGKYHFLRPRLIGYTIVLSVMISALLFALATRVPLSVEALRDRGQLFRETADGMIENSYTLKIQNKAQRAGDYVISASADGMSVTIPTAVRVHLDAGELATRSFTLVADPAQIPDTRVPVHIVVTRVDDDSVHAETKNTFLSPRP
ncbi:MAG: cytochrome c oxidase accessory protein CcoG, partial [Perlucidibaca sp.]